MTYLREQKRIRKPVTPFKLTSSKQQLRVKLNDFHRCVELQNSLSSSESDSDDSEHYTRRAVESESDSDDSEMDVYSKEQQDILSQTAPQIIKVFGTLPTGHSMTINLTDFCAMFYVKIPETWKTLQLDAFLTVVQSKVFYRYRKNVISSQIVLRKPFTEFTGDDLFQFAELKFLNKESMDAFSRVLKRPILVEGLNSNQPTMYDLYESNLDPLLRWIHQSGVDPAGWCEIPSGKYAIVDDSSRSSTTDFEITMNFTELIPLPECLEIAPINIMAMDIEADSSHGDFPIAKKNYQKLAQDLITLYNHEDSRKHPMLKTEADWRQVILTSLKLIFNPNYINHQIHHICTVNHVRPHPETLQQLAYAVNLYLCDADTSEVDADKVCTSAEAVDAEAHLCQLFEANLPPIDTHAIHGSNYFMLSREIISQIHRLQQSGNSRYSSHPVEVIECMMSLAFHPSFDGFNINHVYPKNNMRPKDEILEALVPTVYSLLVGYERFVNAKVLPAVTDIITRDGTVYTDDTFSQDAFIKQLTDVFDEYLPPLEGDIIIQIGSTCQIQGQPDCYLKHILCLKETAGINNDEMIQMENSGVYLPVDDLVKALNALGEAVTTSEVKQWSQDRRKLACEKIAESRQIQQSKTDHSKVIVEWFETERELLLAWAELVRLNDPEILLTYNGFTFDMPFMWDRAVELECSEEFGQLGRLLGRGEGEGHFEPLFIQKQESAAFGDNVLMYLPMKGRAVIDLFKVMQRTEKLSSYSLDSVCAKFLYKEKVNVTPKDIFRLQKGTPSDRQKIAVYCLVDCILCNRLFTKLHIYSSNASMSKVCKVPFTYLFLRGQGIKIFSLVADTCRRHGYLVKVLPQADPESEEWYEGAIVLEGDYSIHFKPIAVGDFNSLYPSSMISENISHDTFVEIGGKYDNLPGVEYVNIEYDDYHWVIPNGKGKARVKSSTKKIREKTGTKTVNRYAQNEKGILPLILIELLTERKATKKRMEAETDPVIEKILDGLQLAYKVTANSLYGQCGAKTSPIFKKSIAASTTATGRKMITFSKNYVETKYYSGIHTLDLEISGIWDDKNKCHLETVFTGRIIEIRGVKVIFGDTDSIGFYMNLFDPDSGEPLSGLYAVYVTMCIATRIFREISAQLKRPQNIVMEKVVWPFLAFVKKRYHGHYFTEMVKLGLGQGPTTMTIAEIETLLQSLAKYKAKSMGIATKRRDSSAIVMKIYGKALDIISTQQDTLGALDFSLTECRKLLRGEYPIEDFVITKCLKGYYKKPNQIAHNVLANRQAQRDPGNRFSPNDRVPYCFIIPPRAFPGMLQGDRIETIPFIDQHQLKIDYGKYLTAQVQVPLCQLFGLDKSLPPLEPVITQLIADFTDEHKGVTLNTKFFTAKTANKLQDDKFKSMCPENQELLNRATRRSYTYTSSTTLGVGHDTHLGVGDGTHLADEGDYVCEDDGAYISVYDVDNPYIA
jgi:DNA polymerase elongation subunit (family B)